MAACGAAERCKPRRPHTGVRLGQEAGWGGHAGVEEGADQTAATCALIMRVATCTQHWTLRLLVSQLLQLEAIGSCVTGSHIGSVR